MESRRNWQVVTVALMVAGYAAYYLCRSDFSVALPLLISELNSRGIPANIATMRLGSIASFGVLAYAIGKFPSGWLADFLGGRRNFLSGMAGSILFTLIFGLAGGVPMFTLAWIGNRLVQSLGWAGIVKITSKWFSYSAYGTVMGIISLSFLFGDAASRQFMSWLLAIGFGWRGIFFAAAATLGVLFLLNVVLLKESPARLGFAEPQANPENLFAHTGDEQKSLASLLNTFVRSPAFWMICLLSLGLTFLRETFNLWTPTYFTQAAGLSATDAAQKSALFPLFGGISVLLAGYLGDRMGRLGRAVILLLGLLLTAAALLALASVDARSSPIVAVRLTAAIGFLMLGPYSYLAGAISLDFGGKQASATASGLIDGIGYFGGVLSGAGIASIFATHGWKGVLVMLAGIAMLSGIAAAVNLALTVKHHRRSDACS